MLQVSRLLGPEPELRYIPSNMARIPSRGMGETRVRLGPAERERGHGCWAALAPERRASPFFVTLAREGYHGRAVGCRNGLDQRHPSRTIRVVSVPARYGSTALAPPRQDGRAIWNWPRSRPYRHRDLYRSKSRAPDKGVKTLAPDVRPGLTADRLERGLTGAAPNTLIPSRASSQQAWRGRWRH